jgi:hypothetical protein
LNDADACQLFRDADERITGDITGGDVDALFLATATGASTLPLLQELDSGGSQLNNVAAAAPEVLRLAYASSKQRANALSFLLTHAYTTANDDDDDDGGGGGGGRDGRVFLTGALVRVVDVDRLFDTALAGGNSRWCECSRHVHLCSCAFYFCARKIISI